MPSYVELYPLLQ